MDFNKRLQILLDRQGWNKQDLAKHANIHKNTVTKCFSGTVPSSLVIKKLAETFNVSIDYLLGYSDEPDGLGALHVAEPEPEYDPHGGWKPRNAPEDFRMANMALEVLSGGSLYSNALAANIQAFHHAMQADKKLILQDEKIKGQEVRIVEQDGKIRALHEKCDKMERMIADLTAQVKTRDPVQT